jgi:hypothetical protein
LVRNLLINLFKLNFLYFYILQFLLGITKPYKSISFYIEETHNLILQQQDVHIASSIGAVPSCVLIQSLHRLRDRLFGNSLLRRKCAISSKIFAWKGREIGLFVTLMVTQIVLSNSNKPIHKLPSPDCLQFHYEVHPLNRLNSW